MGVVEVCTDINATAVSRSHSEHKGNIRLIDTAHKEEGGRGLHYREITLRTLLFAGTKFSEISDLRNFR